MREKISACITAGNEEKNIRRCLESVRWVDEIIVVDSFSLDRTAEICKEYTKLVYEHKWLGYIGQKNLIKSLASNPWILFIDADEEISPELRDEILNEFSNGACANFDAYECPRMVKYLGKWIKHGDWYPDFKLRLFQKDKGLCGGQEPHDRTIVDGPVKQLQNNIYHYTYTDIGDQIATINNFSGISAKADYNEGRSLRISDLLFRPLFRFLRCYFLKLGFMDGLQGLIIACNVSYGVFVKYAKLWELQHTV